MKKVNKYFFNNGDPLLKVDKIKIKSTNNNVTDRKQL